MGDKVSFDIEIEHLVEKYPESAGFLTKNGIRCIRCGEPIWGTLGELLKADNVENPNLILSQLNIYLDQIYKNKDQK